MVTSTDILNIARTLVDSNKDGAITPDEIIKEVTKLASVVNALIPEEVLNELDVDGNGVVDINDLRAKIKEFDKKADEKGNNDGKASTKERIQYLQTHSNHNTRILQWISCVIGWAIISAIMSYFVEGISPDIMNYITVLGSIPISFSGVIIMDKIKNEKEEEKIELQEKNNQLIIEKDALRTNYDAEIMKLNGRISNLTYENEYLKKTQK